MNRGIGWMLLGYSAVLAALSWVVFHFTPSSGKLTLIVGVAGAVLCVLWGARAMVGKARKAGVLLTLAPVAFVLLSQAVTNWGGTVGAGEDRRAAAWVATLLLILTVGVLMRVAYFGVAPIGQAGGSMAGSRDGHGRR
ncbi:MAG TPA: hypothetical protein P5233_03585 [Candidatus Paceibacterota bacterium]|nr:hypothetical protein [Candidatus Paceibacterota bacterium]